SKLRELARDRDGGKRKRAVRRAMRRAALCTALAALPLASVSFSATANASRRSISRKAPLVHTVAITDPAGRYVDIRLEVPKPKGRSSVFAMPAWAPGSYLVRDFGRHVYEVEALAAGGLELPSTRLDKQRWRVDHKGKAFTLSYRVYADELSVRTSYVDD